MTKATLIRAFNWAGLQVQFIIIKGGTRQQPGRHGAEVAESSTFSSEDR